MYMELLQFEDRTSSDVFVMLRATQRLLPLGRILLLKSSYSHLHRIKIEKTATNLRPACETADHSKCIKHQRNKVVMGLQPVYKESKGREMKSTKVQENEALACLAYLWQNITGEQKHELLIFATNNGNSLGVTAINKNQKRWWDCTNTTVPKWERPNSARGSVVEEKMYFFFYYLANFFPNHLDLARDPLHLGEAYQGRRGHHGSPQSRRKALNAVSQLLFISDISC